MSIINTLGPVGLNPTGEYNNTKKYERLDVVLYEGSSYVALKDSIGQLPTNTEYWDCIAVGYLKQNTYDSVAEMKADDTLKAGMYAQTVGYYEANDGGAAIYKITSEESQSEYQEELGNGLYATLKIDEKIKIKQLGALSGNDITSILNFAINTGLQVINDDLDEYFYITSPIDTKTDIKMKNINLVCNFSSDNYLFTFTNNVAGYNLELVDCIINGNLKCIGVNSRLNTKDAKNFILKNVEIFGMSSENNVAGTFPRESAVTMKGANCYAENCNVHDNQGHGLMVFAASSGYSSTGVFNITNCKATGNGVGTYQALGIGSYSGTNNAKCFINNCYAYDNGASGIAPHGINNVIIENCIANNNGEHGFVVQQSNDSIVDNCIALNNVAFGIRVQGDFSQDVSSRFVNNVCVLNNKITGNGINVGVRATKILCKNNIITVSNNQKVFYTDNTTQSRNNGSEDVSFINNIVIGNSYANEVLRDYFNGFVIKNNTDIKGNLLPNGFLVYSGNSNTLNMYISTDKLYEPISPSNTEQMVNISGLNGATISGDTFTTSAEVNVDSFLVIGRFNAKEKMTFVIEYPNGTVPWVRSRNSSQALIADYILINTVENNGYTNKMTLTITKDDSNANSEAIKYIDIALKTVKFEKFPAGTYNFKMECAEGLTLNKL